jgi:hypothetical protein
MKLPVWMVNAGKFLLKVWFPSHHRKITTSVIAVGATLLLDGYFLDGLLHWLARYALAQLTGTAPPEWSETANDAAIWPGVTVIGLGLLFSILVFAIETYEAKLSREGIAREKELSVETERNVLKRDFALYAQFKDQFATHGRMEYFVCNHNFGRSWRSESSDDLHQFVDTWSAPEMKFVDPELAKPFEELLSIMNDLSHHLASHAGPLEVNASFHCIFEPSRHNEMDLPGHVEEAIRRANRLGVAIREKREEFLLLAEKRFSTLPQ